MKVEVEEEKKEDEIAMLIKATTPTGPKKEAQQTQALIRRLYGVSMSEFMTPSVGDAYSVLRDPHLRLRRTLVPSLNLGIPNYTEAQFMLSKAETTGKRVSLEFRVAFDNGNGSGEETKKSFTMDAYVWGASESEADIRILTNHGISPGVSRTRWHKLGHRYGEMEAAGSSTKRVRFVALDWHSIDRSVDDDSNNEFLTCLPKHTMEVPSCEKEREEIIKLFPTAERQEWCRKFCSGISSGICPRSFEDGGRIYQAVIEEGLGWGTPDRPFVLGIKSWSGGLGMRMMAQIHRNRVSGTEDTISFADNLQGAIIMHPGCFDKKDIMDVMSSGIIPSVLMCWAKDDPRVPYEVSKLYLNAASSSGNDSKVKLVTYESGGHHNFDGSDGLPNFDDEIIEWIDRLP